MSIKDKTFKNQLSLENVNRKLQEIDSQILEEGLDFQQIILPPDLPTSEDEDNPPAVEKPTYFDIKHVEFLKERTTTKRKLIQAKQMLEVKEQFLRNNNNVVPLTIKITGDN